MRPGAQPLAERTHACPACGLVIDRDWNAARNILARGLALQQANAGV
ncbi:zinc ribbon domain-containing protein [Sphingomonas corticis]